MKAINLLFRGKENGITLISLIVTVIVLLILAGVTINLTLGENGIFRVAEQAARNYKDAEEKELGLLSEFEASITAGKVAKVENGIQYVGDGIGNLIPVPVGFSYLEGTKNTGFVIKNDTDNNEFVWIPVAGMGYEYDRYDFLNTNPEKEMDEETNSLKIFAEGTFYFTEKMPEDEELSVQSYGGYYIGRYETGKENGELVVQEGKDVYNLVTRDQAKNLAEGVYEKSQNNVTSKLCSSYAWDTALKFIETQNSEFLFSSVGGNYSAQVGGTGQLQKTGYDKVHPCNIYDMNGNAADITTESYNNGGYIYSARGGWFKSISNSFAVMRRSY